MSAIAGILVFDQGASPDERVGIMLAAGIGHLGPDGVRCQTTGAVTLIQRPFHTTVESYAEVQPVAHEDLLVVFDGRIDNRTALLDRLGTRPTGDAELAAMCFWRWGPESFRQMIGDFAIAIWNSRNRELVLARDPFGSRSLYYHVNGRALIFASSAPAILTAAEMPINVDEEYVARYLGAEADVTHSPFRGITPVPPGHFVTVCDCKVTTRRFWDLSEAREVRCKDDREYETRFAYLFEEAVKVRLRASATVMSELSGGLDSSSMVCAADRAADDGHVPPLRTLSIVFDRARTCDERAYIRAVEEGRGIPGFHLRQDEAPVFGCWPDANFVDWPSSVFCFGERLRQVHEAMQSAGARVLLSGWGGDEVLMGQEELPYELADCIVTGCFGRLPGQLGRWAASERRPAIELLWNAAIVPCLPWRWRPKPAGLMAPPQWISPRLRQMARLDDPFRGMLGGERSPKLPSKQAHRAAIQRAIAPVASGYIHYQCTWGCVERRFPFLHRPLVEFLYGIPAGQLKRPGENRSLQRRAMRNILPEKVRSRTGKGGPDEAIFIGLKEARSKLDDALRDSRAAARGYVEVEVVRNVLEQARMGRPMQSQSMLRFFSLEFWLRDLEAWERHRTAKSCDWSTV
jgi:asparagine synthase (glutamine-hydrolysing)